MHYVINALVEKVNMLPCDAPSGGLEAHQRRVTWANLFW